MGILADVMKVKEFEAAQADKDIGQISASIENFVNMSNAAKDNVRKSQLADLQRRNVESQIEARKPSALAQSVERADAITKLREAGDKRSLDVVRSIINPPATAQESLAALTSPTDKVSEVFIQPSAQIKDVDNIDLSRPIINNADGSFSTERTIGIEADGKHINIPTIVDGVQVSEQEAVQAFKEGRNKPTGIFSTREEADQAAQGRSSKIGELRGEEAQQPREEQLHAISQQTDEITGKPTPQALSATAELKRDAKEKANAIAADAAVLMADAKEGDKIRDNMDAGSAKLDLTLNEFINFASEQHDLLKVKPGPLSGFLANTLGKLSATHRNRFFNSFKGSTIELAAFVGRNAMPGTRAARIIDLFKESTPDEFSTMTDGIRNSAVSWGEAIATDFGKHQDEYIPGYSKMNMQEQAQARKEIFFPYQRAQVELMEDTYVVQAYKKNPELFNDKEQSQVKQTIIRDVRRRRGVK